MVEAIESATVPAMWRRSAVASAPHSSIASSSAFVPRSAATTGTPSSRPSSADWPAASSTARSAAAIGSPSRIRHRSRHTGTTRTSGRASWAVTQSGSVRSAAARSNGVAVYAKPSMTMPRSLSRTRTIRRHGLERLSGMAPSSAVRHPRWTLAVVCVATFMLLLDLTIVAVALSDIQGDFHADLGSLQWVVDAYTLPLAGLLLTAATLGDRIGRRRIFLAGMALFTAGSLACAVAWSPPVLDLTRAAQGTGGALLFGVGLPLLAVDLPDQRTERRGRARRGLAPADRVAGQPGPARGLARYRPAHRGAARPAARADPGQRGRLGIHDDRRPVRRSRGAAGRVR